MTIIDMPQDPSIAALDAAAEHHRAPFDGGHVAWRRFGHASPSMPPCVLLHGGHGAWLHWVRNIEALAEHREVWVPDMPGYGDSDMPREMSFASLVDALLASLDTLIARDRPLALAGFSFGGLTAAALAARRDNVTHLALLGAAGHGVARRPRGELRGWRDALADADFEKFDATMRHNLALHMLHDASVIDARAVNIHAWACIRTRFRSRAISRAGGLLDALGDYRGRLLAAWGEHDVTAEPALALRKLAEHRSDVETRVIADAGHWAQYERPEAVDRLLIDFLGRGGAATAAAD